MDEKSWNKIVKEALKTFGWDFKKTPFENQDDLRIYKPELLALLNWLKLKLYKNKVLSTSK